MALDARPEIIAFRGVTNGDGMHDDLLDAVSRIRDLSPDRRSSRTSGCSRSRPSSTASQRVRRPNGGSAVL
jgi:hypothetical protein